MRADMVESHRTFDVQGRGRGGRSGDYERVRRAAIDEFNGLLATARRRLETALNHMEGQWTVAQAPDIERLTARIRQMIEDLHDVES